MKKLSKTSFCVYSSSASGNKMASKHSRGLANKDGQ